MTRGILAAIVPKENGYRVIESQEYNGKMFIRPGSAGEFVCREFPKTEHTPEAFSALCARINTECGFNYKPEDIIPLETDYPREAREDDCFTPGDYLDMTTWNYTSDYVFLRNWTQSPVYVTTGDGETVGIAPGDGAVFYFCGFLTPEGPDSASWGGRRLTPREARDAGLDAEKQAVAACAAAGLTEDETDELTDRGVLPDGTVFEDFADLGEDLTEQYGTLPEEILDCLDLDRLGERHARELEETGQAVILSSGRIAMLA